LKGRATFIALLRGDARWHAAAAPRRERCPALKGRATFIAPLRGTPVTAPMLRGDGSLLRGMPVTSSALRGDGSPLRGDARWHAIRIVDCSPGLDRPGAVTR